MYRKMWEIRFFDQAAGRLYQQGLTKGGIHAYSGQEAIAVGISAHLELTDLITSTHRGHGHHIAKGADLNLLMAEILGKSTGYCKGRGGSMHVAAFDVGSLGAFPVLASGVPSAVGAAISAQLLKKKYVVVTYFGEGALGQGTIFESINIAALWKLPIIFVCENNQYAVSTHFSKSLALKGLHNLAGDYGIQGIHINGQDLVEVHKVAGEAITLARKGGGPMIIQADTYRFEGHYVGEPQVYRSKQEVLQAKATNDPIDRYQEFILENEIAPQSRLEKIKLEAQAAVDEAVRFAKESPEPVEEEYAKYVYS
jgi:pyruvate dehydrogenase E1 component alpha subunit